MRINIDIKIKISFWLKGEIEKNINFYKRDKKKIRNQNNEDQIEKYNTINLDWMKKLIINKYFTQGPKSKIKKHKNKDQIEKYNIWLIGIARWNWKQINLLKSSQEQKLEIKRIRTEVKMPTIKRINL